MPGAPPSRHGGKWRAWSSKTSDASSPARNPFGRLPPPPREGHHEKTTSVLHAPGSDGRSPAAASRQGKRRSPLDSGSLAANCRRASRAQDRTGLPGRTPPDVETLRPGLEEAGSGDPAGDRSQARARGSGSEAEGGAKFGSRPV